MKKKLVLFGAFDRYNYGDNLMPIVLNEFIKKYSPELLDDYEVCYSSISDSNLSHYRCEKTISIEKLIPSLDDKSVVVVVGGDVLCADAPDLFLHVQSGETQVKLLKLLRRISNTLYSKLANSVYSTPWDYPYIPDLECLPSGTKVIYNTVGGSFRHLKEQDYKKVSARIAESDFVSVRNNDLFEEVTKINSNAVLSPDSVYIIERLFDDSFFSNKVSRDLLQLKEQNYVVFQAAPDKLGESVETVVDQLKKLSASMDAEVILLPIGYASGHSDLTVSQMISRASNSEFRILHDLNVWEIMYVLKECSMYIGTSLHGVITAMSYGKPHFGINENVEKLDRFLKTWSVEPFNKCYPASNISLFNELGNQKALSEFFEKNEETKNLVHANNLKIVSKIYE